MRGAFVVLSIAVVAGCSSAPSTPSGAEPEPSEGRGNPVPAETTGAEIGGADVSAPEEEEPYVIGPSEPSTPTFNCRKGAFCDDFEGPFPTPLWTETVATGSASVSLASISATSGAHSLAIAANDAASAGYMRFAGKTVGNAWAGAVQFAFRATSLPVTSLAGPSLVVLRADGDPASIGVVLDAEGLVLVQREGPVEVSRSVLAPALADHWYRIAIGFEANAPQTGGVRFGRVETTVDDDGLVAHDLRVPAVGGGLELFAGVTRGDTVPSSSLVDDVSFFVR